jgi:TRAP-type C4-dicarboxylate transport system substrate-binding protein
MRGRIRPPFRALTAGLLAALLLPAALCAAPAGALTLKIATVAPAGSPWVDSLRRLAAEWDRLSGGTVKLKIYAGGIVGEEPDMIRKLRIGQLQGAALSQLGLGLLEPGVLALSVPFLIQEEGELDYVLERIRPYFESKLAAQGYRLLNLSKAGWVRFFGREPLIYPEDLRRLKLGVPAGDAEFVNTWRRMGFDAFSLPFADLLAGLQAGMIDAFYAPPLVAATFQWFGPARHMTELPIAPVVAAVIITSSSVERIPARLRPSLLETFQRLEIELNREMESLEAQALSAMKAKGLKIHTVPPQAAEQWKRVGRQGVQVVLGKSLPEESYRLVVDLLAEYHRRKADER